jgi:hypothetical protein
MRSILRVQMMHRVAVALVGHGGFDTIVVEQQPVDGCGGRVVFLKSIC